MKKRKKSFIVLGCIALCIILLITLKYFDLKRKYPGIETNFASMKEFEEYGGYIAIETPKGASDFRYYINRSIFKYESIYSFVVNDEQEYNALMKSIKTTDMEKDVSPSELPMQSRFDYVMDEDIEDYMILEYDSFDGSHNGIIVDEKSKRFVCFKLAGW